MTYTIEIENADAIEQLELLAKQNGISFRVKKNIAERGGDDSGKKLAEALERVAKNGGLQSFGEPSDWQREQRKDRKIIDRE